MSNINYVSINENFPVAGQDNDTQVFRDNFDTIKTSLRYAKEELEVFQSSTTGAARLNQSNDFNQNVISNAVLQGNRDALFDGGNYAAPTLDVTYTNGSYQIYKFGANVEINFLEFPENETPAGVGKVTLELYSDGSSRTITFKSIGGLVYKKNAAFPSTLTLTSANQSDPVIIEVWRYKSSTIFLNYVGVSKTTPSVFDQTSKLVSLTTGARDAAAADAAVGYLIYNTTTSKVQVCTSIGPVVWVDLN